MSTDSASDAAVTGSEGEMKFPVCTTTANFLHEILQTLRQTHRLMDSDRTNLLAPMLCSMMCGLSATKPADLAFRGLWSTHGFDVAEGHFRGPPVWDVLEGRISEILRTSGYRLCASD